MDVAKGQNPHVNYEPSALNGLKEAPKSGPDHTPYYQGNLVREKISLTNDFKQAGERYCMFEDWERDDLILNLVNTIKMAEKHIQDKMVEMFKQSDPEYGRRVEEGLLQTNGAVKKGLMGSTHSNEAVVQAEQQSQESKPY